MGTQPDDATLPIAFTTHTPYVLPSQRFMIPASWKRYQLSQLVNKALSLLKPIPFDFLVRGELLHGSLAEWCTERGIGAEETLEVEYFESVMPPTRTASIPHDDWVSSVSCQIRGHFVTGSYDGVVRVYDSSQQLVQAVSRHTAPVTSVCVVKSTESHTQDACLIASASHDMTARLSSFTFNDDDMASEPRIRTLASLHLHTAPLSSISSSSSGNHLLTSSWDTLIGVWDTSIPSTDEVPIDLDVNDRKSKRRKLGTAEGKEEDGPKRKAPMTVLKSHTNRVMRAAFVKDDRHAISCGLDSTIRMWDVEAGVCVNTLTASEKPFLDLATTLDCNAALAASTDRTISLYDIRHLTSTAPTSSSALSPTLGALPHPSLPSCICASPIRQTQVISGSYDGIARMWDLRSLKSPVAVLHTADKEGARGRGGKVLCVDWASWGEGLVGIGNEKTLEVWRVGSSENANAV